MQIDSLGKRYGLLPSEVLTRADTFDVYVLDAALSYERHYEAKHSGKPPELSKDELIDIFNRNNNEGKVYNK